MQTGVESFMYIPHILTFILGGCANGKLFLVEIETKNVSEPGFDYSNTNGGNDCEKKCSQFSTSSTTYFGVKRKRLLKYCIDDCKIKRGCKTEFGENCVFPFIFNDVQYSSCTTDPVAEPQDKFSRGRAWCSTKVDDEGVHWDGMRKLDFQGSWGYCRDGCKLASCDQKYAVSGPGKEDIPMYSFNKKTWACTRFSYGGSEGNSNKFKTLTDCQKKCMDKEDPRIKWNKKNLECYSHKNCKLGEGGVIGKHCLKGKCTTKEFSYCGAYWKPCSRCGEDTCENYYYCVWDHCLNKCQRWVRGQHLDFKTEHCDRCAKSSGCNYYSSQCKWDKCQEKCLSSGSALLVNASCLEQ